jgi:hypothetical protein
MALLSTLKRNLMEEYYFRTFTRAAASLYYLGPWKGLMVRYAQWRARDRNPEMNPESVVSGIDRGMAAAGLESNGYSGTFQVREDIADEILSVIRNSGKEKLEGLHKSNDSVKKLVYDPAILEVLHDFFGVYPIVNYSVLNVVNPAATLQKPVDADCQKDFHYDVPDFKGLALFLYLNEVDRNGGHHVLIPETHKRLTWKKLKNRRITYRQARQDFGEKSFVHITGPKGTAFMEDTVCWHKRCLACLERYALMVVYTLQRN